MKKKITQHLALKEKEQEVRCSFKIPEAKLRRFHEKLKRNGHSIDDLLGAFISAYDTRKSTGASLDLLIIVTRKSV